MPNDSSLLSRKHIVLLVLILATGAALRLYDLAGPELQWDEFLALHRASMPVGQLIESLNSQSASDVYQDTSPPLHHLLIHIAAAISTSDFAVRVPGVLFGVLSLFILFIVGKAFVDIKTGLCAALYAALLQFHLFYSRYMRWYVFFYCFALLSLYCLKKLIDSPSRRTIVAYGLATAAMLYSSYVAAPFVLAQMCFTGALCLVLCRQPQTRPQAWRLARDHFWGLALAGILYLPQVKGQLIAYHTFYRAGGHSIDYYRIAKAFREMTVYFRDSDFSGTGLVLLLMACGLVRLWATRPRRDFWLLLLYCLVPTVAAFCINVQTQITAKYLIGLFFAILLLTGAGAAQVTDCLLARLWPDKPGRAARFQPLPALALVLFVCGANLDYAPFYRGWSHAYANWTRHLLTVRQDADFLMLENNRGKKVIVRHELGDAFRYFDTLTDHGYKRFHFIGHKDGNEPPGLVRTLIKPQSDETLLFSRGGLVSRAPILVAPGPDGRFSFTDPFKTLSFYETVWKAENVAPDFNGHTLSLYSLDKPGYAVWKLIQAPGADCRRLTVRLDAWLRNKIPQAEPDARLVVSAGADPAHLAPIDTIDFSRFVAHNPPLAKADASGTFHLPVAAAVPWADPSAPLYVRLDFLGGRHVAYADISRLHFETACNPPSPVIDVAVATLGHLAANARIIPWVQGRAILGDDVLYAFATNDALHPAPPAGSPVLWQSAADWARFVQSHPGLDPVTTVAGPEGAPAFVLYDPRLARSDLELPAGQEHLLAVEGSLPRTLRGMVYTGTTSRPTLTLGETTMAIPLSVPAGSTVLLNPGGEGLVSFSPLFTKEGFNLFNMVRRENLHVENNALTCLEDKPCLAQYVIASELPIKGLRATLFPSTKNDKKNHVQVFYGLNDMADRRTLIDFSERNTMDISSTHGGITREVRFDKDVKTLFVGIDLTGRGARAHSDEQSTMRFEVLLDAAALPRPVLDRTPVTIRQDSETGETMFLWLDTRPLAVDRLWTLR
jgi:uncharacterized membrane protein